MKKVKKYEGFTIIEVVLVLAIAGLIFLMVFIAWPALQRSQRDTQRRNDYSMLSTAISNFITNNNGKLDRLVSSDGYLASDSYINETGEDPNGHVYALRVVKCGSTAAGTVCGTTAPAETGSKYKTKEGDSATGATVGNEVYVVVGADCSATDADNARSVPGANNSSKAFAIYGYLEGGSNTFCSASQ